MRISTTAFCAMALLGGCGGTAIDKSRTSDGAQSGGAGSAGRTSLSGGEAGFIGGIVLVTGGAPSAGGATGAGGGLTGQSCDMTTDSAKIDVTPTDPLPDGGPAPHGESLSAEFDGSVTALTRTGFTIDTCPPNADCTASLRTVTIDAPGLDLTTLLPVGAFAHVQFALSCSWGCTKDIVVTSLPSWGGLTNPAPAGSGIYVAANDGGQLLTDAPFKASRVKLDCPSTFIGGCGDPGEAGLYAFEFGFPNSNAEIVTMGSTKTIAVGTGAVTVRNLRSYETGDCDDYWNWAYWVTDRRPPRL